ncbi:hypothetical protein FRZ67_06330 [Panacibacter ginsenosidivorans]|uniref:Uncharacterized protein n=1 Tax=Panacibacter ginsenosidivorans TaxID=1813871 RepID=A0A5B8V6L8_9BACT|nr:hypothetical protein [Panacibacter ginsenosidivorans]QEC66932.1 hypothetical protein FRZ67_06330 [Panacibacter ginsenosidivorans]
MPGTLYLMKLHLRYRLWIAEMNEDISVLRIFDDHLAELQSRHEPTTANAVNNYKQQFAGFRKTIDELKHEMHLRKMDIAALTKEEVNTEKEKNEKELHVVLEKRYNDFRKQFDAFKNSFVLLDA